MAMLLTLAYTLILGKPLVLWLGLLTLLSVLFTATVAILNRHGIHTIPARWHPRFAAIAIILALIHGTMAFLAY
ncbi:MAG: hypothetical protein CW742_02565 [Methanoregula sp.]|nr:MAG: hypothetical protein CW742_02565 [Methanoregula sp.]